MKIAPALFLFAITACGHSQYLPPMPPFHSQRLQAIVKEAAARYSVAPKLVSAVIMAESAGDPTAVSRAGAQGLMQLMPATSADCGILNVFDANENVDCGTRYLRRMLNRYHGNVNFALAAYNAGPGAVDRYRSIPPYSETRAYVHQIVGALQR